MQGCVVSFKECWQDDDGRWLSYGGFPLQMEAIASLFDRLTIVAVRGRARAGGICLPANASVMLLDKPAGEDFVRKLSVFRRLPYYLREVGHFVQASDAVYIPLPGDIPLLGMMVSLALRKRMLARYGGSWLPTAQTTLMNRITRACMRMFAGGPNVMLATGLGNHPPAPNMQWIFVTAISEQEIAAIKPDLDRPAVDPLRVVYAGRLSPEKGVDLLIEAVGMINRRMTVARRLTVSIFGDGPQRDALEALAKRHHCENLITFAGQLNRQELLLQLLAADVCVLPSRTESFCKARLDAMLCGVPVITSEVGFGRELVGKDGERGWLVPSGEAPPIADLLQMLLESSVDWPRIRKTCCEFVAPMSLEAWTSAIGAICARQWGLRLEEGKLR
jgi:glycosyltransferase involved in cell wall biosynthesis